MFDPKCYEIALHFLLDDEPGVKDEEVNALAQEIQDAIEAWLNGRASVERPPLR
jgi:hypothetical protein